MVLERRKLDIIGGKVFRLFVSSNGVRLQLNSLDFLLKLAFLDELKKTFRLEVSFGL